VTKELFVTITGSNYYYGMKPFEIGRIIRLVKEPENEFDLEAIRAELPFINKIGYVANNPQTVAKGTISAGRLYDQIENEAYAQVLFVTSSKVICRVLDAEEMKNNDHDPKEETEHEGRENMPDLLEIKGHEDKPRFRIG
jgi:hypothetical protein